MNHLRFVASVAIVAIASFVSAQETQKHPGAVAIDWREQLKAEPKVSVNLNQALMRFVTAAASEAATEVPGLRDIIGQLALVRVEVYEGVGYAALATAAERRPRGRRRGRSRQRDDAAQRRLDRRPRGDRRGPRRDGVRQRRR